MLAQQAVADRMKGAGPGDLASRPDGVRIFRGSRRGQDALRPAGHLGGGASGEGQQQDALRHDAGQDQIGDPVRQRVRLPGARAGDDQQRAGELRPAKLGDAVLDRRSLGFVQAAEVWRAIHAARLLRSTSVPRIARTLPLSRSSLIAQK